MASRLGEALKEYERLGRNLQATRKEIAQARYGARHSSRGKRREFSSQIKLLKDDIAAMEERRGQILAGSGPFREKLLNDDRFRGGSPAETMQGSSEEEEDARGGVPLGTLQCSEGVSGGPPDGQDYPLPASSDEEEVPASVGGLVLQQIKLLESPIDPQSFSFGDDLLEGDSGVSGKVRSAKSKKRQKGQIIEKLTFQFSSPGSASELDQGAGRSSACPVAPQNAAQHVGMASGTGTTGGRGGGAAARPQEAGEGVAKRKETAAARPQAAGGARERREAVRLQELADLVEQTLSGGPASSPSFSCPGGVASSGGSEQPAPSRVCMSGGGVAVGQGRKPSTLSRVDKSVARGVDSDGSDASLSRGAVGATPGPVKVGKRVQVPGDKVLGSQGGGSGGVEGSQGPAIPPAATAPRRSYASVAAGGSGEASSLPGGVSDGHLQQRLLESLRKGATSMVVDGREVDLSFWVERYGLGAFRQQGGETVWSLPTVGQEVARRNVARLRWVGNEACPSRKDVVERLLKMKFRAADIFALIHPYGTKEFDISFVTPNGLEAFWSAYELVKSEPDWRGFVAQAVSRQSGVKRVTVLTRNESLSCYDIMTWLSRYGEVTDLPRKNLDEHGIWSGAWTFMVKLKRSGHTVAHIPSSAFLGRDRILIFYPGQPKVCHRCGSPTHLSAACQVVRCSLCGGDGHLAAACEQIRCHLCGDLGHPFSRCPRSFCRLVANTARRAVDAVGAAGSGGGAQESVKTTRSSASVRKRQRGGGSAGAPAKVGVMRAPRTDDGEDLETEALEGTDMEEEVERMDREEASLGHDSDASQYESVDEEDRGELEEKCAGVTPKATQGSKSSGPCPGRAEGRTSKPSVEVANRYQALSSGEEEDVEPVASGDAESSSEGDVVAPKGKAVRKSRGKGDAGREEPSAMDTSVSKKR
ncbi:zinc finger, partial [Pristimantis euphronides]